MVVDGDGKSVGVFVSVVRTVVFNTGERGRIKRGNNHALLRECSSHAS